MPDLLLELFSEEIPARMQAKAADDLKKLMTDRLVAAGLTYEGARAFATPRRLALWVQGLPVRQPDLREEKRGPRVGAPEAAVQGFLKSAGLASIDQARIEKDAKKGEFYVAVTVRAGRQAIEVIAEITPEVVRAFPWPKAMRWGTASAAPGALTWVRPLHAIVATFGPETEAPDIVPFSVGGITAGDVTRGHRFLAPEPFRVRRLDDYVAKLKDAKVILDASRRADEIRQEATSLAFAQGFELVEDAQLLAEVAGLVEWPVVLMGSFDESFLTIPPEVIRTTIRNNQKCFVLTQPSGASPFETRPAAAPQGEGKESAAAANTKPHPEEPAITDPHPEEAAITDPHPEEAAITDPHPEEARSAVSKDGRTLAPKFILVANTEATDGGAAIIAGNERVIRARLSDAKFFYEVDLKLPLEQRLDKLKEIVFHEKLGTQYERVERIERLARELAPIVGADPENAARAARLAKADLVTEMVGEFPELQGLMGKYYALAQGEDAAVARACEEHYKPLGPTDRVPTDPVSVAVALADKIDTLVGFWAIDEKPTGSKDPYALRRAALGVIRLVVENRLRVSLLGPVRHAHEQLVRSERNAFRLFVHDLESDFFELLQFWKDEADWCLTDEDGVVTFREAEWPLPYGKEIWRYGGEKSLNADAVSGAFFAQKLTPDLFGKEFLHQSSILGVLNRLPRDLLAFFFDRLKVQLREQGSRHDLVDAVLSQEGEGQDDLLLVVRRVEALGKFLDTDDGKNLLAGYKRATNIIRIEEKKDATTYTGAVDERLLSDPAEMHLWTTIQGTVADARHHVTHEDFEGAMATLSTLRSAVDAFFEKVTVNVDDRALRANRLNLLNQIRLATLEVADFSKIAG